MTPKENEKSSITNLKAFHQLRQSEELPSPLRRYFLLGGLGLVTSVATGVAAGIILNPPTSPRPIPTPELPKPQVESIDQLFAQERYIEGFTAILKKHFREDRNQRLWEAINLAAIYPNVVQIDEVNEQQFIGPRLPNTVIDPDIRTVTMSLYEADPKTTDNLIYVVTKFNKLSQKVVAETIRFEVTKEGKLTQWRTIGNIITMDLKTLENIGSEVINDRNAFSSWDVTAVNELDEITERSILKEEKVSETSGTKQINTSLSIKDTGEATIKSNSTFSPSNP